jgi:hypothetical protein
MQWASSIALLIQLLLWPSKAVQTQDLALEKKKSSKAELNNSILLLKAQTQLYRKKGKLGG